MRADEPERGFEVVRGSAQGDSEDAIWVRQARSGDLAAFERIYDKFHRRIYGLCLRMTGNRSVAEELVQETFVRVWEKRHLIEPERGFAAWLHRVAVNVVLSDRRSKRRRAQLVDPGAEPDDLEASRPVAGPVGREAGLDLERAMEHLPPRARAVFVLHDIEGHRHEEIARLTGVAVGTSKAQLHRARRILREALRP
jgi:RNA polymerase sigma-70 factor (ECF subfamily)